MAEKKYLDLNGLGTVAANVNTRLKTVTAMPAFADDGAVRLYVGENTASYTKGHTYQYSESGSEWVDITPPAGDLTPYQTKTLDTALTIDGASQTTVEGALGGLNTLGASNKTKADTLIGNDTGMSARQIANAVMGSPLVPKGSTTFANLPDLADATVGWFYTVTDAFTTTSDFVEGAGTSVPADTDVMVIDAGSGVKKWDVMGELVDLSGYQTKLTFDSTPTSGSTNPVTSGGVYDYTKMLKALFSPTKRIVGEAIRKFLDVSNPYTKTATVTGVYQFILFKHSHGNTVTISVNGVTRCGCPFWGTDSGGTVVLDQTDICYTPTIFLNKGDVITISSDNSSSSSTARWFVNNVNYWGIEE